MCALSDNDLCLRSQTTQQLQHRSQPHRDAAGGRCKFLPRQVQEHGAAAMRDARATVVIDLDDEVIEMILAFQAVAGGIARALDRPVVMPIVGVLAPGIVTADRLHGQKRPWPRVTVGAPPQFFGMEDAPGRAAVAFALVGADAAAAERDGNV